jgi:hypothetical protein
MTTRNTSHPVNTLPFLSEEMERTLRLRAWKDEKFREALIADPKGVIQRLFPQCFPNGKLPEELTLKVIEEDPGTCHIVIPPLPDEFPTAEIPEEGQLELLAYMGRLDSPEKRRSDSSDKRESQSREKSKPDFMRQHYERKPETASEPLTRDKIASLVKDNKGFRQKLLDARNAPSEMERNKMYRETLKEYFPNDKVFEKRTFKVTQDTADTRHLVFEKLPDTSLDTALPKHEQFGGQSGDATCRATSCGCTDSNACK